jgi:type II secretory ATPase GspE/PulE/Tfp pilus assembly ATPase PilB-like protein
MTSFSGNENFIDSNWISNVLDHAIDKHASDIHIDPNQQGSVIRLRIDGMLYEIGSFDINLHASAVSQIKILSNLDIVNVFIPQDGQFEHLSNDQKHYIRVSTFPTIYGEAVVMRILNHTKSSLRIQDLGLYEQQVSDLYSIIINPFGMVLVTGPTGSGKSTLLNSILAQLNTEQNNIITVENPVEFRINGVRQTQINPTHDFGFAEALRAILRQDPDIMMIGEIRDSETAQVAVQAALAGRLLFSTFHTFDLLGIVARFIEMNIPRSVIAHILNGVISARLVRKICNNCREPHELSDYEKFVFRKYAIADIQFFQGHGCEKCNNTGYDGTVGIYEIVPFDTELRTAVLDNVSSADFNKIIKGKKILTLFEGALVKARDGVTTTAEVIRVIGAK